MKAENRGNEGFLQRESVEHQGYAEARSTDRSEGKERDGASDLLEAILDRDNLNRACLPRANEQPNVCWNPAGGIWRES